MRTIASLGGLWCLCNKKGFFNCDEQFAAAQLLLGTYLILVTHSKHTYSTYLIQGCDMCFELRHFGNV